MKPVLAVPIGPSITWGTGTLANRFGTIGTLVQVLLNNAITLASVLLLIFLIYGGLQYIIGAGGGDPKKAQAAQGIIVNTLVGFVVVFTAYFIVQIVEVITGLNILNSPL